MKIGITSKLFFAILLSCALVAFAVSAGMRYSFNQGFLGYLNEREAQRIEVLRPSLAKVYQEHGNWDFLRGNPRQWFRLLRQHATPGAQPDADEGEISSTRNAESLKSQSPEQARPSREQSAEERRANRPPPPESDLTGLQLRISLLDAQRKLVIGNRRPGKDAVAHPIEVDGQTVGWITLVPFQQVSTGAALRFQEQQLKTSWIVGGLAIALAALVAWLLAQMFIAPLKKIAAATHRLARGDYKTRVAVSSSDELAQLAGDFNQLALTLEKNEQLRRVFMADVSHELRTPLAVLKGELEALEDGIRPMSMASVQSLQTEVGTLGKLINDLYELSLSDVGALTYRKERTDVLDTLRTMLPSFGDKFAGKDIRLDLHIATHESAVVNADPDRLRQLFANLLENAVRYTDAGGRLQIGFSKTADAVTLDFQDTKPGVADESLPLLFERFYRVEGSRSRATGGAGLGLAISRNIVDAHQGTIVARASPLGGLWIAVTLPLAGAGS